MTMIFIRAQRVGLWIVQKEVGVIGCGIKRRMCTRVFVQSKVQLANVLEHHRADE